MTSTLFFFTEWLIYSASDLTVHVSMPRKALTS